MSGGKCPDIPRQLPSDKFVRTWTIPLQVRKLGTYKFDFAQLIKTGEVECSTVPKTKAVCAYHVYVQYIPRYNVYMYFLQHNASAVFISVTVGYCFRFYS